MRKYYLLGLLLWLLFPSTCFTENLQRKIPFSQNGEILWRSNDGINITLKDNSLQIFADRKGWMWIDNPGKLWKDFPYLVISYDSNKPVKLEIGYSNNKKDKYLFTLPEKKHRIEINVPIQLRNIHHISISLAQNTTLVLKKMFFYKEVKTVKDLSLFPPSKGITFKKIKNKNKVRYIFTSEKPFGEMRKTLHIKLDQKSSKNLFAVFYYGEKNKFPYALKVPLEKIDVNIKVPSPENNIHKLMLLLDNSVKLNKVVLEVNKKKNSLSPVCMISKNMKNKNFEPVINTSVQSYYGKKIVFLNGKPFLPRGAEYHFLQHIDTWEDDLDAMILANIDTIRIDFGWNDIEKEEGVFDFSKLDEFLNIAKKKGLYVLLSTQYNSGGPLVTDWFIEKYKHTTWQMLDQHGNKCWGNFPSPNSRLYKDAYFNYVKEVVKHCKNNPVVIGYQFYNEPHYSENDMCDYNPENIANFRNYLKKIYSDNINNLNKEWGTNYEDFQEIEPERNIDKNHWYNNDEVNWPAWKDWRLYNFSVWENYCKEATETIKSVDPNKIVVTTVMPWWLWGQGCRADVTPDLFKYTDVIGYDIYSGNDECDVPAFCGNHLITYYHYNKAVWMTEFNEKNGNPERESLFQFALNSLNQGVSGLFFFEWSDKNNFLDGGYYGLVNENGWPKLAYYYLSDLYQEIKQNESSFLSKQIPDSLIYTAFSKNLIACAWGDIDLTYSYRTPFYFYQFKSNLPVNLININDIGNIKSKKDKLLIIPNLMFISPDELNALIDYVKNGGNILVDVPFAEKSLSRNPEFNLVDKVKELLGGIPLKKSYYSHFTMSQDFGGLSSGENIPSSKYSYTLSNTTGIFVLGKWSDGSPAFTKHILGKGNVYFVGTNICNGCLWNYNDTTMEIYADFYYSLFSKITNSYTRESIK